MNKILKQKRGNFSAIQYDGTNMTEVREFVGNKVWNEYRLTENDKNTFIDITTPAGKLTLLPGRWILKVEEPDKEPYYIVLEDAEVKVLFDIEENDTDKE